MAQPQFATHQGCAHCSDCAIAQPVVTHIAHASPEQTAGAAAALMQPSAPAPSFTLPQAAPMLPPQTPEALVARAVPPPLQPAPPPPRAAQQLKVLVPNGISAGQQLQFVTPDGQSMYVTVQQDCAPGSYVMAQYQPMQQHQPQAARPPAPMPGLVPPPLPQALADGDRQATNNAWMLYCLGWLSCCFVPLLAPVIWLALAASYFCCMSPQQRAQRPGQRGPATAAGVTCLAIGLVCAAVAFVALIAFVAALPDGSGMMHHHGNHSHPRPDWPAKLDHHLFLRGTVQTEPPYSMQEAPWADIDSGMISAGTAAASKIQGQEPQVTDISTTSKITETTTGASKAPCRFGRAAQQLKKMVAATRARHEVFMKTWSFHSPGGDPVMAGSEEPGAETATTEKPSGPCAFKRAAHHIKQWLSGQDEPLIE